MRSQDAFQQKRRYKLTDIIVYGSLFMLAVMATLLVVGRGWNKSYYGFLFADRSLQIGSSGLAISAHWFWAIAIFVGPAIAYNWGIIGALWFAIPNATSLLVIGFIMSRVRERYPEGYSLTRYVKENFSARIGMLYQLEFLLVAFAALILAFTAVAKLWAFAGLSATVAPIYASLAIGLVTLAFTANGGIRTSIFTGALQSVLWFALLGVAYVMLASSGNTFISTGKNDLTTFFDYKFITTFAVAWVITVTAASSGHGMMWQKAFSMPKENIMPTFTFAAIVFAVTTFMISALGMYAFANGFEVKAPDTTQLLALSALLGTGAVIAFATILIGQTSTVIDSALNYVGSLISMEWLNKENVTASRISMIVFMLGAWLISWLQIEIWTVVMLMGVIRVSMFVPVLLHSLNVKIRENAVFYGSLIAVFGGFYLSYTARIETLPIYDMYSALFSLLVPMTVLLVTREKQQS